MFDLAGLLSGNRVAYILIELGIILLGGFCFTRITKLLKLPNVTGYIICGILIGPSVFNLISSDFVSALDFVSDIALAIIAFGVGKYFKISTLKKAGPKVLLITVLEALTAGIIVFIVTYFCFHLSLSFVLILSAIATSTAPASTMLTIKQYDAKGEFVDTLLQVVALDDVICLLLYSVAIAVADGMETQSVSYQVVLMPILYNLLFIVVGFVAGVLISVLLGKRRNRDVRLILLMAAVLLLCGCCSIFDVSPLLCCMVLGATYINFEKDTKVFETMDRFSSPVTCIFFVRSGMALSLGALKSIGLIGLVYFLIRIVGKLLGSYVGCLITKKPKLVRNYLGLALIPQAGVSIGLAVMGQRLLPADMGEMLLTIILASSLLYELIGPVSAKASLYLSKSIPPKEEEATTEMVPDPIVIPQPSEVCLPVNAVQDKVNN